MNEVWKHSQTTESGTRMFRAIVDDWVCIRPEWFFDPFQDAVPCFQDNNPTSKTKYIWILRSNYGYGWQDESAAETRKEILQTLKEYRENCPQAQYRIVGRREVKQQYQ